VSACKSMHPSVCAAQPTHKSEVRALAGMQAQVWWLPLVCCQLLSHALGFGRRCACAGHCPPTPTTSHGTACTGTGLSSCCPRWWRTQRRGCRPSGRTKWPRCCTACPTWPPASTCTSTRSSCCCRCVRGVRRMRACMGGSSGRQAKRVQPCAAADPDCSRPLIPPTRGVLLATPHSLG